MLVVLANFLFEDVQEVVAYMSLAPVGTPFAMMLLLDLF